jgi:hypothetical protein
VETFKGPDPGGTMLRKKRLLRLAAGIVKKDESGEEGGEGIGVKGACGGIGGPGR